MAAGNIELRPFQNIACGVAIVDVVAARRREELKSVGIVKQHDIITVEIAGAVFRFGESLPAERIKEIGNDGPIFHFGQRYDARWSRGANGAKDGSDVVHLLLTFSEPKTKRGRRTVELSTPTVAVIRAHRQHQLERRLMVGELWTDLDLVFPTSLGTPQDGSYVSRVFAGIAAEAGVEGLRFHDLRHSSVSLLLKSGEPMAGVSRRAGHSTIGITVDTYGHDLGAGGSMAATMGTILKRAVGDGTGWLANG